MHVFRFKTTDISTIDWLSKKLTWKRLSTCNLVRLYAKLNKIFLDKQAINS